jgi:biotin carboxylase
MDILIIHKMAYGKIDYHLGIDHAAHRVTYAGTASALSNVPAELRCERLERPGLGAVHEELIAAIEQQGLHFDRVISLSEYELMDAARVRERFNIPGPRVAEVELVRDKLAMKRAVSRAGLRVPRFLALAAAAKHPAAMEWTGPCVVKPVDGAKSEDVRVFPDAQALGRALANRATGIARLDRAEPDLQGYEVEEFISGPVVHFDGLVADGRVVVLVASRYLNTCLAFAEGQPLGSYQRPLQPGESAWAQRVLSAVSIRQGSFHLEAIEHHGELVFLEVANRFGGADVVATVELATGVHLPSAELAVLTGGDAPAPHEAPGSQSKYFGWFVFPGHQLKAAGWRVEGADRFRSSPQVVKWNQLSPEATLPGGVTYGASESPLAGIAQGPGPEALRSFMEDLFATVQVR